jgi:protein gp37
MPTKIEWCDETINPLGQGCYGPGGTKENPNVCPYCYAKRLANRGMRGCELCKQFVPHTHFEQLDKLKQWKNPRKIFVQSMGDLFHDEILDEWIETVFLACEEAPQHTYLFLTKNPKRYKESIPQWKSYHGRLKNMWFGTTVTSESDIQRAFDLLNNTSKGLNKFLSIEPLLGEVDLNDHELLLKNYRNISTIGNYIDWVIVGQQTGPGAKPPKDEWVQDIIDQCKAAGVPVFIKHPLYEKFPIQEWPESLVLSHG